MSKPFCPQCQRPLPANAPHGFCPACLLNVGLDMGPGQDSTAANQTAAAGSTSGPNRFSPLSTQELNKRLTNFDFLELLGQGGMGAVYKARQKELNRIVAIKILPSELGSDAGFKERFAREARALALLHHQHIVVVFDYGQADDLCYIVMQFVDGTDLRQVIESGNIDPQQALTIVKQICEALQFAHSQGIVHRDIKPENILIDKSGNVRIADFGLAKLVDSNEVEASLTGTRQVMGTLRYMAPEQTRKTKSVDHRADIFSLGVVFYELLTGDLPIGRFQPPSQKAEVDARLDSVVLRALENEPADRYQQASDVSLDIESIAAWQQTAPLQSVAPKPPVKAGEQFAPLAANPAPMRFSKRAVWGFALFVLGFVGAILVLFSVQTVTGSNVNADLAPPNRSPIWYLVSLGAIGLLLIAVASLFLTPWLGLRALADIRASNGQMYGRRLALFDIMIYPLLLLDFLIVMLTFGLQISTAMLLLFFLVFNSVVFAIVWWQIRKLPGLQRAGEEPKHSSGKGRVSRVRLIRLLVCLNIAVLILAFAFAPLSPGSLMHRNEFEHIWNEVVYRRQNALWISFATIVLSVGIYFFLAPTDDE